MNFEGISPGDTSALSGDISREYRLTAPVADFSDEIQTTSVRNESSSIENQGPTTSLETSVLTVQLLRHFAENPGQWFVFPFLLLSPLLIPII